MSREDRFVEFVGNLWKNHRKCFRYSERPWIRKITNREEKIFAIVLRTLICNEQCEQQLVQKEFGAFRETRKKFLELGEDGFKDWTKEKIKSIPFGIDENGKPWRGAHRDNRHKPDFPRALSEYMQLVGRSQIQFFDRFSDFDSAFKEIKHIHSLGNLTSFDILERLYRTEENLEAKPFQYHPERFYLTGGGVSRGLRKIYAYMSSNRELEEQGNILVHKIIEEFDVAKEIVYYEVENTLCIYQKDKYPNYIKSEHLLNGCFKPKEFADIYAQKYCKSNKTVC